jgi:hypothetical protein
MLKDIYEDLKKYQSDKRENNKNVFAFNSEIGK